MFRLRYWCGTFISYFSLVFLYIYVKVKNILRIFPSWKIIQLRIALRLAWKIWFLHKKRLTWVFAPSFMWQMKLTATWYVNDMNRYESNDYIQSNFAYTVIKDPEYYLILVISIFSIRKSSLALKWFIIKKNIYFVDVKIYF